MNVPLRRSCSMIKSHSRVRFQQSLKSLPSMSTCRVASIPVVQRLLPQRDAEHAIFSVLDKVVEPLPVHAVAPDRGTERPQGALRQRAALLVAVLTPRQHGVRARNRSPNHPTNRARTETEARATP